MADKAVNKGEGKDLSETGPKMKSKSLSLIPPKKKSVKKMMAEYIMNSVTSSTSENKDKDKGEGKDLSETGPKMKSKSLSLIPPKKKSVKKMMAEYIMNSVTSSTSENKDKYKNKQRINPDDAGTD